MSRTSIAVGISARLARVRRGATVACAVLAWSAVGCGSADRKRVDEAAEASLDLERRISMVLPPIDAPDLPPVAPTVRIVMGADGTYLDAAPSMIVRYGAGSLQEADSSRIGPPERLALPPVVASPTRGASILVPLQRSLEPLRQREQRLLVAAGAGQQPPAITLFVASDTPSGVVFNVAHTAEQAGFRVQFAVRQRGQAMALPLRAGQSDDIPSELALRVVLTAAGVRIAGSGGTLAPGCRTTGDADAVTVARSAGRRVGPSVQRCLFGIKQEFPEETEATVWAEAQVPFQEIAQLLIVARGDSPSPLFPNTTLGFGPEPASPVPWGGVPRREVDETRPPAGSGTREDSIHGRVAFAGGQETGGVGELDQSQVLRTVRSRHSGFRHCYERSLRGDPTLSGRVVVRFTIEPQGTVSSAIDTENSTGDAALAGCVVGIVRRLRWSPGPEGGSVTFSYPFIFEPG